MEIKKEKALLRYTSNFSGHSSWETYYKLDQTSFSSWYDFFGGEVVMLFVYGFYLIKLIVIINALFVSAEWTDAGNK